MLGREHRASTTRPCTYLLHQLHTLHHVLHPHPSSTSNIHTPPPPPCIHTPPPRLASTPSSTPQHFFPLRLLNSSHTLLPPPIPQPPSPRPSHPFPSMPRFQRPLPLPPAPVGGAQSCGTAGRDRACHTTTRGGRPAPCVYTKMSDIHFGVARAQRGAVSTATPSGFMVPSRCATFCLLTVVGGSTAATRLHHRRGVGRPEKKGKYEVEGDQMVGGMEARCLGKICGVRNGN